MKNIGKFLAISICVNNMINAMVTLTFHQHGDYDFISEQSNSTLIPNISRSDKLDDSVVYSFNFIKYFSFAVYFSGYTTYSTEVSYKNDSAPYYYNVSKYPYGSISIANIINSNNCKGNTLNVYASINAGQITNVSGVVDSADEIPYYITMNINGKTILQSQSNPQGVINEGQFTFICMSPDDNIDIYLNQINIPNNN